jgi:hypothetical protein
MGEGKITVAMRTTVDAPSVGLLNLSRYEIDRLLALMDRSAELAEADTLSFEFVSYQDTSIRYVQDDQGGVVTEELLAQEEADDRWAVVTLETLEELGLLDGAGRLLDGYPVIKESCEVWRDAVRWRAEAHGSLLLTATLRRPELLRLREEDFAE